MKKPIFLFMLLVSLLYVLPGFSAIVRSGESITISSPVTGDLYIAGGDLHIEAVIAGDIVGAGGKIVVRDTILEDAILAGGNLRIEAPIRDDARLAGGEVLINSDVFGDVMIGGGEVKIAEGVTIYGDLYIGGGEVHIAGKVMGKIDAAGGEVEFEGEAGSAVSLKGGDLVINGIIRGPAQLVAGNIELATSAQFHDQVRYWRKGGEMEFGSALVGKAEATYDEELRNRFDEMDWRKAFGMGLITLLVFRVLSAAFLILLLIWAFHGFFKRAVALASQTNPASSFGYGFLYLVGVPIAVVLAFISIIGIPAGIIGGSIYGFSLALGHVLASIILTYWVWENRRAEWSKGQAMLVSIGFYLLLKLVSFLPVLGWLISLVLVASALGVILLGIFRRREELENVS